MQLIKTPADLGHILRARRKQLGWNQAQLAEQIGVSRQWLIDIEKGKPRAELGLALRAIYALGLSMHLGQGKDETTQRTSPAIDLDNIIERAKPAVRRGLLDDHFRAENVSRLLHGQDRVAEMAKQYSTGIPEDLHNLMREQNNAVEVARQLSGNARNTRPVERIDIPAKKSKRGPTRPSPGGKPR